MRCHSLEELARRRAIEAYCELVIYTGMGLIMVIVALGGL